MLQIMRIYLFQDGLIIIFQILQGQLFLMIVKILVFKGRDSFVSL